MLPVWYYTSAPSLTPTTYARNAPNDTLQHGAQRSVVAALQFRKIGEGYLQAAAFRERLSDTSLQLYNTIGADNPDSPRVRIP